MSDFLSVLIVGLSFGLVLFLLGAGLSLTLGLMRIINLSHGALYMLGGFVGWTVVQHTDNFWLGILAGAACTAVIGLVLEVGFLRRLYNQPTSQVLLSIGFIYIIVNIAQWIWGSYPGGSPVPGILSGSVPIGDVTVPVFRFFIIGFGLVMAVLLWLLQDKTKIGAIVRAGMDDREIAGAMGINLKVVFTGVFTLGAAIAGLCGLIGASTTGISLGVAWDALLLSMIVVIVGGAGSIQGALIGGIIIGLVNAFGTAYIPRFASYLIYGALIIVLLVRPTGILGRRSHQAPAVAVPGKPSARKSRGPGGAASSSAGVDERQGGAAVLLHKYLPYALVLILLFAAPSFTSSYLLSMITKVIIFALFAMSLDLSMGYAGLVSFGHAAFLGIAGYTVGILTVKTDLTSFWVTALIAIAITTLVAAVVGYICLRCSGIYYLLVTMAFGLLFAITATQWSSLTDGTDGLVGIGYPDVGFSINWDAKKYYYMVLLIFVFCYYVLHRIVHSAFGTALVGVRMNEPRMRSLGFRTWRLKYVVVVMGGAFAGVAGVLYAHFYGNMVPSYLGLQMSAMPMLMVVMGGRGTLYGPCTAAAVIVLAQHYAGIYAPDRWPLILGVMFVLCVLLLRRGIASHLVAGWARVRFVRARPNASDDPVSREGKR